MTWKISTNTSEATSYQVLKDAFYSWWKALVYQLQWPGNALDLNIWDEQKGPSLGIPRRQNQDQELPKLTDVEWNQFLNPIPLLSCNMLKTWTHLRFLHLVRMFQTWNYASLCIYLWNIMMVDPSFLNKAAVEIVQVLILSSSCFRSAKW